MRSPPRLTVVDSFDDPTCQRIVASGDATFYADDTLGVRYATTRRETFVSAARWHLPVGALCDLIGQYGDDLPYTSPAAFALALWRKRFAGPVYRLAPGFDVDMSGAALYGGRCEVYQYLDNAPAHQYDWNAAYPTAATQLRFPHPLSLKYAKPPTLDNIWYYEGVSRVEFSQSGDFPILPIRYGGRVLYPHCDHVTGTYTHSELRYALHHTPTIQLHRITKQYCAHDLLPTNPFTPFVDFCYDERARTGAKIWKVIPNSLFGRLAVRGAGLWRFTPTTDLAQLRAVPVAQRGFFGVPCVGVPSRAPARGNLLWAALVLSQARCALHNLLDSTVAYVDTDCVFCTTPRDLPCSANMGDFKYKYGAYTIRGTQAYEVTTPEGTDLKLRGVGRAHRTSADFMRAQTTQERVRLPDGSTIPRQLPA